MAGDILINTAGLVVNSFRDAEGRGSYFPGSSGTSEGQFLFALGCLDAYLATGSASAKLLATKTLRPILPVMYRNAAVPAQVTDIEAFAPHWLFNVKYPFTSAVVHLDRLFTFTNGVATIPANPDEPFRNFFNVRSANSNFLWQNPYSALRTGSFYPATVAVDAAGTATVTLNTSFSGSAFITYSTLSGPEVAVNENFEAWPDWRKLEPGEIACAVDVFVWAHRCFERAYQVFPIQTWANAARATRQQAAIAFDINDSRDWIKPTYTRNPFSEGSMFSYITREPAPRITSDSRGRMVISAQSTSSGGEIQVGNASRKDFYKSGDKTEVTIGSDRTMVVSVYIDLYQAYSEDNRYQATLNLKGGAVRTFTLLRSQFKNPAGESLPAGAPVYTFGFDMRDPADWEVTIGRVRQLPSLDTAYYPGAIPFTANFQGLPATLIDWRGPVYMGYQAPPMWKTVGNVPAAITDTQLLSDAQDQWVLQTGQPARGPFAPVFYFNRADAVQYGPANTFGWEGPDPNTKWGGYQYRPLAEVAELGGSDGTLLGANSKQVARDFLDWLAQDHIWLPLHPEAAGDFNTEMTKLMTFGDGATGIVDPGLPLGPPTDFPKGAAEINYPEPHMAALILRSVIFINGGNPATMTMADKAVVNKCVSLFRRMYTTSGKMAGTFTSGDQNADWFGFWHGEILTTLAKFIPFAHAAGWTEAEADARLWITGLLNFARSNTEVPVDAGGEFGPMITTPINWTESPKEEIAYATQIFTSESGREQRISQRPEARRALTYRFAFLDGERQAVEALLRSSQNKPILLPHWHMAVSLESGNFGDDVIFCRQDVPDYFEFGADIVISSGRRFFRAKIRAVSGPSITLSRPLQENWPEGSKVAVAFPAMAGATNFKHQTSTVSESTIRFAMPPQTDGDVLPETAAPVLFTVGADVREVIVEKVNWATNPTSVFDWAYTPVVYNVGPTRALETSETGTRQFQGVWLIKNAAQAQSVKARLNRLKGKFKACWMPSGLNDLSIRAVPAGNQIDVLANAFTASPLLREKTTALCIELFDGSYRFARVLSVSTELGRAVLTLDRQFPIPFNNDQVKRISLMYRVRQVNDTAMITWKTDLVGELTVAFVTVYDDY